MTFKPLLLLVAALLSTTGFAAEESDKELALPAAVDASDKKLSWPVFAKDGVVHRYEMHSVKSEEKDGKNMATSVEVKD